MRVIDSVLRLQHHHHHLRGPSWFAPARKKTRLTVRKHGVNALVKRSPPCFAGKQPRRVDRASERSTLGAFLPRARRRRRDANSAPGPRITNAACAEGGRPSSRSLAGACESPEAVGGSTPRQMEKRLATAELVPATERAAPLDLPFSEGPNALPLFAESG